ncbi:hypothetical protein [Billgrantia bachuensis]|uniref:Uncharacterized protein n=1 Tax=Billgrantia bachuensis TaxID=2717286 RepID=A0ABX0PPN5_9GAMM|nr:hypothetical protein [Halomonas bachuensis]NIC05269.1 hypothetical protein [Halomonas bachuensis]
MPQLTLSRRTVVAPTPGLTGTADKSRKAVFGLPGDSLKVKAPTLNNGVRWYKATLLRAGRRVGSGYVIEAALMGQPGVEKVLAGATRHG